MSWSDMLAKTLQEKCIEVREPLHGHRHNKKTIYVRHRFPVKGGISWDEAMTRQFLQPMTSRLSALLERSAK